MIALVQTVYLMLLAAVIICGIRIIQLLRRGATPNLSTLNALRVAVTAEALWLTTAIYLFAVDAQSHLSLALGVATVASVTTGAIIANQRYTGAV